MEAQRPVGERARDHRLGGAVVRRQPDGRSLLDLPAGTGQGVLRRDDAAPSIQAVVVAEEDLHAGAVLLVLAQIGWNYRSADASERSVFADLGRATLADVETMCRTTAERFGLAVEFRQSNHEGELVDWIQEANAKKAGGIVINPAGYRLAVITPIVDENRHASSFLIWTQTPIFNTRSGHQEPLLSAELKTTTIARVSRRSPKAAPTSGPNRGSKPRASEPFIH